MEKKKIKLPVVVSPKGSDEGGKSMVTDMYFDEETLSGKSIRPFTLDGKVSPNRAVLFKNLQNTDPETFIIALGVNDLLHKLEGLGIIKVVD